MLYSSYSCNKTQYFRLWLYDSDLYSNCSLIALWLLSDCSLISLWPRKMMIDYSTKTNLDGTNGDQHFISSCRSQKVFKHFFIVLNLTFVPPTSRPSTSEKSYVLSFCSPISWSLKKLPQSLLDWLLFVIALPFLKKSPCLHQFLEIFFSHNSLFHDLTLSLDKKWHTKGEVLEV